MCRGTGRRCHREKQSQRCPSHLETAGGSSSRRPPARTRGLMPLYPGTSLPEIGKLEQVQRAAAKAITGWSEQGEAEGAEPAGRAGAAHEHPGSAGTGQGQVPSAEEAGKPSEIGKNEAEKKCWRGQVTRGRETLIPPPRQHLHTQPSVFIILQAPESPKSHQMDDLSTSTRSSVPFQPFTSNQVLHQLGRDNRKSNHICSRARSTFCLEEDGVDDPNLAAAPTSTHTALQVRAAPLVEESPKGLSFGVKKQEFIPVGPRLRLPVGHSGFAARGQDLGDRTAQSRQQAGRQLREPMDRRNHRLP